MQPNQDKDTSYSTIPTHPLSQFLFCSNNMIYISGTRKKYSIPDEIDKKLKPILEEVKYARKIWERTITRLRRSPDKNGFLDLYLHPFFRLREEGATEGELEQAAEKTLFLLEDVFEIIDKNS